MYIYMRANLCHLKAHVNELAFDFVNSPIDSKTFLYRQNHRQVVQISGQHYIIRPEKGSGFVILNSSDYINKMSFYIGRH